MTDGRHQKMLERTGQLIARYRHVADHAMAGLPICNPALTVDTTTFHAVGNKVVGIVVTPWFMNLVAFPQDDEEQDAATPGTTIVLDLPIGQVDLICGELDGFGRLDACSLFSPMENFSSMDVALEVAEAALAEFMTMPEPAPSPVNTAASTARPVMSRRGLLSGRFQPREDHP